MSKKRKAGEAFSGSDNRSEVPKGRVSSKDRARSLLQTRQTLPIWPHSDQVRESLRQNDVLLLVGETGSGKSTQVPQFLYSEKWCRKSQVSSSRGQKVRVGGCIAITQPRRVAAISLAKRVAEEVGTPLGSSSPASQVGYSVRFDHSTSPATKIKFLTDGMLLQELLRDPWLREYSCVIVDEVHERGVNIDLVLGFLKNLVTGSNKKDGRCGIPLKVVVMSATADMDKISSFFSSDSALSTTLQDNSEAKKSLIPAENGQADDWNGFSDVEDENATELSVNGISHGYKAVSVASCFIQGRQFPVQVSYVPRAVDNILDAAMERIMHLHTSTPLPGDILVFLSGQEMIENLESLCKTYAGNISQQQQHQSQKEKKREKLPQLQVLPLYAALPTQLQQRVFQPAPPFTRKVILATDIAETSVTVSGVRHVIDTGKHKSRHFRPALNLDTLLTGPISRSSAAQRAGRAGREAPGSCYRLYTQESFFKLEQDTPPEILQTDLSFPVLTLKSHGVEDVLNFPLLTPPPRRSLESAIIHLLQLDALDPTSGRITNIGRKMSMLPLRADLARILLASTLPQYECVDEIIDIVAGLSLEEGIWLPLHNRRGNPDEQEEGNLSHSSPSSAPPLPPPPPPPPNHLLLQPAGWDNSQGRPDWSLADSDNDDEESSNPVLAARRALFRREGDHLTLLAAIQSYTSPTTHDRREWCDTHGVSHRAMSRIMDVRKQLRKMVLDDSNPKRRLRLDHASSAFSSKGDEVARGSNDSLGKEGGALLHQLDLSQRILKCLLTGLWPNTATLTSATAAGGPAPTASAPYTTVLTRQPLHIHPSSFLFNHASAAAAGSRQKKKSKTTSASVSESRRPPAAPTIMFTDFIYTAKPYARNVSMVEMKWMDELGAS